MKCLLIASCLISVTYGGSISGSYLPGATTNAIFGGVGGGHGGANLAGASISGSYLPGLTTNAIFGGVGGGHGGVNLAGLGGFSGSGSYQSVGGNGFGVGGAGGLSYSGLDGFGHGGGASLVGGETSFFPSISHDAKSFEFGDVSQTQPGHAGEVHFYGGANTGEKTRLRIHVGAAPRKTSVLYVKSPDAGSSVIPEIVAPKVASEDKTLVYVLSKKPEQLGSITIPSALSYNVVKSKPEVYYLKYNNQHDAERAVSESLGGRAAGSSVQYVSSKDSFVRTLQDDGFSGAGVGGGFASHGVSFGELGGNGFGGVGGFGGASRFVGSGQGGLFGFGSSGARYGVPGASGPY